MNGDGKKYQFIISKEKSVVLFPTGKKIELTFFKLFAVDWDGLNNWENIYEPISLEYFTLPN